MIAGAGAVVYGAGHIVGGLIEKAKNGKYVKTETCAAIHKLNDERWETMKSTLDKIDDWIDAQRDAAVNAQRDAQFDAKRENSGGHRQADRAR